MWSGLALEFSDQLVRRCHQGFDDVPVLLSGGGDGAAQGGEVLGAFWGAEPAGDFLAQFPHSTIAFGLIVGKRNVGVGKETQGLGFVVLEPEGEIVSDAAFLSPAFAGLRRRERWLRLMKGERLGEDPIIGSSDPVEQRFGGRSCHCSGEMNDSIGARQEPVHAPGPVLFFDVDQGLKFAQVMGVAERV